MRYFAPLYPLSAIFIAEGYYWLKARFSRAATIIFIALAVISLMSSLFLLGLDQKAYSGFYEAKDYDGYTIISIYGEFMREPTNDTYHPSFFGLFEIPFITRPYTVERPPPDMEFHSDLYHYLEENYHHVDDIYVDGRLTFKVYEE